MTQIKTYAQTFTLGGQSLHASIQNRTAVLVLTLLAGLSALLYWQAFVQSYNLLVLWQRPLLDLHKLSQAAPLARWSLLAAFLAQGALYWLGWRIAQRARGPLAWTIVLGGALAFGLILLFMYPFGAADIFDNIMHGRILGVHGANPFTQVAQQFSADPFLWYTAWRRTPSAYGPAWEVVAAGIAHLAGNGIIANVLLFKLANGLFLAASVGLVAAILQRMAPERALAGVVLLAWNPVILYETLGNGHNDMAMVVWILAAAWALLERRYTLAVLALVLGALIKYIPLLLLPAASLIALRDLPNWRARLRWLIVTGLLSLSLIVLAYAPFWQGWAVLTLARRMSLFTTSLPAVIVAWLQPKWGAAYSAWLVSQTAAGLTALFAIWQGWLARQDRSWLSFSRAAFHILMFYLLLTCLWFQPWYALWPLGVAALLPPGHAARLAALFGYMMLSKPLIFEPLWLWPPPLPPPNWRELRLGPAVLAVPWLYTAAALWHAQGMKRKPQRYTE